MAAGCERARRRRRGRSQNASATARSEFIRRFSSATTPPPPLPVVESFAAGPPLAGTPLEELTLCVIDVETTGLSPTADRVLELAAVRFTADGEVLGEMHTLVDPESPVAATFVHGIDDGMVAGAPCFRDVAGQLLALLDGAV